LKNKNKSHKVKMFVESVKSSARAGAAMSAAAKKTPEEIEREKYLKIVAEKKRMEAELAALMKSSLSIKQAVVPAGVDPKSVLCEFFKAGVCEKGAKCKFGHDLSLGRKAAKADIYTDRRAEDKMEDWDQAKLEEVVSSKHGAVAPVHQTDIVCQYFLDAIEKEQYGASSCGEGGGGT
jgi:hypothetical protein